MSERVSILGAGSWVTALAIHCARIGHEVRLWGRDPEFMEELRTGRVNARYMPSVPLSETVVPTSALDEALDRAGLVIVAIPSHGVRAVLRQARSLLPPNVVLVSATKGLEEGTLSRMSQVVREEAGIRTRLSAVWAQLRRRGGAQSPDSGCCGVRRPGSRGIRAGSLERADVQALRQ